LPGDGNDVKQLPPRYRYDLHGNMMQMPHLPLMQWDFKDQLYATSQQVRNDGGKPEMTYFVYDASGQRVRKITECQADAGQTPTRRKERIYLGGFEIYREYNGDGTTVNLERETLHIMDDQQRIALVETRTQGNDNSPLQLIRYQLGNHLGSASLELSDRGAIVSYEEYYPYGSTSYQGGRSVAEVGLKRYRYTGKERDGETGLYYHGARYYADWLGRWVSCDPAGLVDGTNIYVYGLGNPTNLIDLTGTQCVGSAEQCPPTSESSNIWSFLWRDESPKETGGRSIAPPVPAPSKTPIPSAPTRSAPDPITQTEWVFPTTKHSPISMVRSLDTGNLALNFTLNKVVLPWRNLLAAIENTPFEAMGDLDDAMKRSPLKMEWQALQDMAPLFPAMGLAIEASEASQVLKFDLAELVNDTRGGIKIPGTVEPSLLKPPPGEEMFVGEWLNQNLQMQQNLNVAEFQSNPHQMAQLVPSHIPYRAIPQYGGYAIEYGLKARIENHPILGNIVEHIPAGIQRLPGGAADFTVKQPFIQWQLKPWDSTTALAASKKMNAGKDYTFLTYTIDWSKLRL
jgi:RHS repeat-associated protein